MFSICPSIRPLSVNTYFACRYFNKTCHKCSSYEYRHCLKVFKVIGQRSGLYEYKWKRHDTFCLCGVEDQLFLQKLCRIKLCFEIIGK